MLSSNAHADLEVRILARAQASGKAGYRVELTLDQAQEFSGAADLDGLQAWDASGLETREHYGERLFERLFPEGDLKAAWDRILGQSPLRRIRLRIDPELPHLHVIQWELLRIPGGAPGADVALRTATPFCRYLAQESQPGRPILTRPIRVLVAISNPADLQQKYGLPPVDAVAEFTSLVSATTGIKDDNGNPAIQFDLLQGPCTLDAIRDQLKTGYHILHFVGHGVFAQLPSGGAMRDEAALLMCDPVKGNTAVRVADQAIASMLANLLAETTHDDEDRLRLVFLESCDTAKRSANDAFRGLAPMLVKAGVAAVIAMQDLIEVQTARPFSAVFYRQLLQHGMVDVACNEARDAVKTRQLRGADVPVLFMRLRSGELLRVKGQISSGGEATFWTRLIARINGDTCIPFLGPRMNRGILPRPETIATEVALKNGYRLADAYNLARVAQFEAFKDPDAFRATYLDVLKASLCRTIGSTPPAVDAKALARMHLTEFVDTVGWTVMADRIEECRIYESLAAIQLPLYITTNPDCFMFQALKARAGQDAAQVRRIGPRWRKATEGAPSHSLLNPEPGSNTPYVLHLNGFDDPNDPSQLEHLALSEDDLMAAFVRLVRDQVEILPSNVLTRLAESSWVFLGYSLDDWEFRLVVQGLLQPIAQAGAKKKLHVGVQLESASATGDLTGDDVRAYLQDYLGGRFNITVYWGTPGQFVSQLHERYTNG